MDASGKPVVDAEITANVQEAQAAHTAMSVGAVYRVRWLCTGWEVQPLTKTDAKGCFELHDFPWGVPSITVRATRNNDRVEWTGRLRTSVPRCR